MRHSALTGHPHSLLSGVSLSTFTDTYKSSCTNPSQIAFQINGAPVCAADLSVIMEQGVLTLSDGSMTQDVTLHGYIGIKPKAFVVLNEGQEASEGLADELKGFVKDRLATYKYPRWIEFASDLPKTATGKIQRFKLRT